MIINGLRGAPMDFVSHAVVGATLYQIIRPRRAGHAGPLFWATLIGSEMPDSDIILRIDGDITYLLNHRGITHSLPAVFLMSALLAYFLRRRYPAASVHSLFGWTSIAGVIHVLLDALNTWGTRIWFPFSSTWVTWDVLPFVDPLLIIICASSILAGLVSHRNSRRFAVAALTLLMVYIVGRCVLHHHFLHELQWQYASTPVQKISVLPTLHPLKWEAVLETKTSILFGNINPTTMQVDCTSWLPAYEDSLLSRCRSDWVIARSLPFFRYPAVSLQQDAGRNIIVISDLYFGTNMHRRAVFELRSDGSIKQRHRIKTPIIQ